MECWLARLGPRLWLALSLMSMGCVGGVTGPGGGGDNTPYDPDDPFSDAVELTVFELRDPSAGMQPDEGTQVFVKDVVVTAISPADAEGHYDFVLAEPAGGAYSAIYVDDQDGVATATDTLEIGQRLDVTARFTRIEGDGRLELTAWSGAVSWRGNDGQVPSSTYAAAQMDSINSNMKDVLVCLNGQVTIEASAGTPGQFVVGASGASLVVDDELWPDAELYRSVGATINRLCGITYVNEGETQLRPRFFSDAPSAQPNALTIYDIQDDASEQHPDIGSLVRLEHVVVTSILGGGDFCARELEGGDYSTVYVRDVDAITSATMQVGDKFIILGDYTESGGSEVLLNHGYSSLIQESRNASTGPAPAVPNEPPCSG